MDGQGPLEYASPDTPPPRAQALVPPALSPENVRFRRRVKLGLWLAFAIGMIPYPTQVCPSLKLQAVDDLGLPATDLIHARWSGYANKEHSNGGLPFDMSGKASLPRQRIWATPIGRVLSILGGILPHNGFPGPPSASIDFNVPSAYDFDAAAMGLIPDRTWTTGTTQVWHDPQTGDRVTLQSAYSGGNDTVGIDIEGPGRWGSKDYNVKIVFKRKQVPATRQVTTPPTSP
jgi:hypothetical protein